MSKKTEENGWGDSSRIKTIDTIGSIRIRPRMYVGGTEDPRQHHLAYSVLDNVLENCRAGRGDTVAVTCRGSDITITDNAIIPLKERVVDRFYEVFKPIGPIVQELNSEMIGV